MIALTPSEAKKLATTSFGQLDDVRLAESLDRKTTLSIGWFHLGPRRGLRACYAVRMGIDLDDHGIAKGGCGLFASNMAAEAAAYFLKCAGGES